MRATPVLLLALTGCGMSPLQVAVTVADAAALAGDRAAPVLEEHCTAPLRAAVAEGDAQTGRRLADVCDPAIATYDALRTAHVALRAAIVAAHGGYSVAALAPLVTEVAATSAGLAETIAAVSGGPR